MEYENHRDCDTAQAIKLRNPGGVLSSGDSIVAIVDYIYLLLLNIMPYPENEITDVDVRIANCTVLLPWKQ
jgi:hypothetical protein